MRAKIRSQSMSIRPATSEDVAALADVHVASWQAAYRGIFPDPFLDGLDRAARATWWSLFIGDGRPVYVADAGRVVGFCTFDAADDMGWGEVTAIYVHPDHWGQGHGHGLLQSAMRSMAGVGFERALLWVLEANGRGRKFYEREGWARARPIRVEEIGGIQVTELRYEVSLMPSSPPGAR